MLSVSPDASQFNLILPSTFFIEEIVEKYSIHLQQYNYPFDSIQQMFNESFQSYDMPDFGYTMNSQNTIDVNGAGYDWNQIPKTSEQALISDKLIKLTYRHTNAFMTYFMCLELLFARYKLGPNPTNRDPFGTIILQTLGITGEPICKIKLAKCQIVGLNGISFTYADGKRDFSTFDLTIGYTEFSTSLMIPELITK